jgi:hypothetical protein
MANLIGTTVAANYLKAQAPFSRFSTRNLNFYSVEISGVETNFNAANSLFAQAVRGIQLNAEMFYVGLPSAGAFIVAVAEDTVQDEIEGASNRTWSLKEAVDQATDETSTVTQVNVIGSAFV